MPEKQSILWTLNRNCSIDWVEKFNTINIDVIHQPLIKPDSIITPALIKKINQSIKSVDAILITSAVAAQILVDQFHSFVENMSYTFSHSANQILQQSEIKTEYYLAENINSFSIEIQGKKTVNKLLHLCSTFSKTEDWDFLNISGKKVQQIPVYTPNPLKYEEGSIIRNLNWDSIPTIAFGSPSGIQGFINVFQDVETAAENLRDKITAVMGNTTEEALTNLLGIKADVVPHASTSEDLCQSIFKKIKMKKSNYESAA